MSPLEGNSFRRPSVHGADAEASGFQVIRGPVAVAFTLAVTVGLGDADVFAHSAWVDDSGTDVPAVIQGVERQATITEIPADYAAEYALLRPIPVEFDRIHGNIVACFREAQLSFAGVDRQDALDHLLDWIIGTYDSLIAKDPGILGPIPAQQLDVLKRHVRRA